MGGIVIAPGAVMILTINYLDQHADAKRVCIPQRLVYSASIPAK